MILPAALPRRSVKHPSSPRSPTPTLQKPYTNGYCASLDPQLMRLIAEGGRLIGSAWLRSDLKARLGVTGLPLKNDVLDIALFGASKSGFTDDLGMLVDHPVCPG